MAYLYPVPTLRECLPGNSLRWVIPALKQDRLIWNELCEGSLLDKAALLFKGKPRKWSSAHLGLLVLGSSISPEELSSDMELAAEPEIISKAGRIYEQFSHGNDIPNTLENTVAIALKLREKRNISASWSDVFQELSQPRANGDQYSNILPTTICCLKGIIHDPEDMLTALYHQHLSPDSIFLALLSSPQPDKEKGLEILNILQGFKPGDQMAFVRNLRANWPSLAQILISRLIDAGISLVEESGNGSDEIVRDENDLSSLAAKLGMVLDRIELLELSSDQGDQSTLLDYARQSSEKLLASVTGKWLANSISNKAESPAKSSNSETISLIKKGIPNQVAKLSLAYTDADMQENSAELLESFEDDLLPEVLIVHALNAIESGDEQLAARYGNQAIDAYENITGSLTKRGYDHKLNPAEIAAHLKTLLGLFIRLKNPKLAKRTALLASILSPGDPFIQMSLANAYSKVNDHESAVETASLAFASEQDDIELQRKYADVHENGDLWEDALSARLEIVNDSENPSKADLEKLAVCALEANRVDIAAENAAIVKSLDPSCGDADLILGKAEEMKGDLGSAIELYSQATLLSPANSSGWLALARAYMQDQENEKALTTLLKANTAVADSSEIQLELGEMYLNKGEQTKAASALSKAIELLEESEISPSSRLGRETALKLGRILSAVGRSDEAEVLLQDAYLSNPGNRDLAKSLGRLLLDKGKPEDAIGVFEDIINKEPGEQNIYLDYGKAVLGSGRPPTDAINALNKALTLSPNHAETTAFLAEALGKNGDHQASADHYQLALESELSSDPIWMARLAAGFGKILLHLDQPDEALEILTKGIKRDTTNLSISQAISQAYQLKGDNEAALKAAQAVITLEPDDVDNLSWYAKQTASLGRHDMAIAALEKSIDLAPYKNDLRIELGYSQIAAGENAAAALTFNSILSKDYATVLDLYDAGSGLVEIGKYNDAILCFLQSIECSDKEPVAVELSVRLHSALARTHMLLEDDQNALGVIDRALEIFSDDSSLHLLKANLLCKVECFDAAITSVNQAVELGNNDAELLIKAAKLSRQAGDIHRALEIAEKCVDVCFLDYEKNANTLSAVVLAAELSWVLLDNKHAREIMDLLGNGDQGLIHLNADILNKEIAAQTEYHCLGAEIALENEEEINTASFLNLAVEINPEHPWVNILQARMTSRQGDFKTAVESLVALGQLSLDDHQLAYQGLIKACIESMLWSTADKAFQSLLVKKQIDPRTHLYQAQFLLKKAESQRLNQLLNIRENTPGPEALSDQSKQIFDDALASIDQQNASTHASDLISEMYMRGKAAFSPELVNINELISLNGNPDNIAQSIASLITMGKGAEASALAQETISLRSGEVFQNPMLAAYAILGLMQTDPHAGLTQSRDTRQHLSRCVQLYPYEAVFHALHAQAAYHAGEIEEASETILSALAIWPNESRWHSFAGLLAVEQICEDTPEHLEKALGHYEHAVSLEPTHFPHYLAYGELLERSDRLKDAIQAYQQASSAAPGELEPAVAMARTCLESKQYHTAIQYAERAVKIDPSFTPAKLIYAELCLVINKAKTALMYTNDILNSDVNNQKALVLKANSLEQLGQIEEAVDVLDRAIAVSGDGLKLNLEKVNLIQKIAGNEAAINQLHRIRRRYPNNRYILSELAFAQAEVGEYEKSVQSGLIALKLFDNDEDHQQQVQLNHLIGKGMLRSDQANKAAKYLDRAVALDAKHVDSYITLGQLFHERNDFAKAQEAFSLAMSIDPENAEAYMQSGMAYKDAKEYLDAEEMLRKASELDPLNISIHRRLGAMVALNLVHNRQQAIFELS